MAPAVEAITGIVLCGRYLSFAKSCYLKVGKCTGTVPAIEAEMKYLGDW